MKIYLIRHFETDWNAQGILQGSRDISINQNIDPESVADNSKLIEGIDFDCILTSKYKRTKQTAKHYGIKDVKEEVLVNEVNFGKYEGRPKKEMLEDLGEQWRNDPKSLHLGESMIDFEARLFSFLRVYSNCQNVLVFTHGGVIRGLRSIKENGNIDRMNHFHVKNNELVQLEFVRSEIDQLSRRRVLVLGGGVDQLDMIELSHRRGYETIVMDQNPQAPGFEAADHRVLASIKNVQDVLATAERFNIDAVTSFITEVSLSAMRETSIKRGLPWYFADEALDATLDKYLMREILIKNNINDLPFCQPRNQEETEEFALEHGFPLVMKTARSAGQVNVYKIETMEELIRIYRKYFSTLDPDELILEKFVEGPEINVVYTVYDGTIMDLIVSDRQTNQDAFGVVKRHEYPSKYVSEIQTSMREKCQEINNALGIRFGVVYPQMIYTSEQKLVMIEIGARVPGGQMKEVMEYASGIDLVAFCLDISLGQIKPYEYYRTIPTSNAVFVTFLNCEPGLLRAGKVSKLSIDPECFESVRVKAIDYFSTNGTDLEVRPLKEGRDRFVYVITVGSDKKEAHQEFRFVLDHLDLVDVNGDSLVDRDFDIDPFYLVDYLS